jgi:histidyl-tRNA synthetase
VAERKQFWAIKGVRDILPPDSALWNRVEQTARDVFATYGYAEIRLPVLERMHLFERTLGLESDVVSKEMYTVLSREANDELWVWRDVASEWNVPLDDPDALDQFEDALERLLESLDIKLSEDESFGGAVADSALHALWAKLDELREARRKGIPPKDLETLVGRIRDEVATIREEELVLRPEATASVVRAYIEHGMHSLPGDVKLYYMGPMFRRERPQKGRYRQFYQIGAEVLGQSDHPAIDAEVIEMLMLYLDRLGLAGAALFINSIGCKECRPVYVAKLRTALEKVREKLGADSQRRIETNPLRVLDSKLPEEQAFIEKLPRIGDHLCAACRDHFAQVQQQLKQRGIANEINWRLVRGLDYYMRTTFEITAPGLGAQNAICGGGRYDGLVELLGGPPTKGIGFAIGTDRLVLALQEAGKQAAGGHLDVYLAWIGAATSPVYSAALQLARRLRGEGFAVELPAEETKLKKALGLADRLGARYAVLLGEDEMKSGTFVLRRMADGEQKKLSESELIAHLKSEPSAQSAASG